MLISRPINLAKFLIRLDSNLIPLFPCRVNLPNRQTRGKNEKTSAYAFVIALMSSSACFAQFLTGELKSLESMIKNATVQNQMASPKYKEKPVANVMTGTYLGTYNGVKSKSDFIQIKTVQDGGLSAYIEVTAEGTPPGWLELEFKRHGNAYKFLSNEASDIGACEIELVFINSTVIKLSQSNNSCGLAGRQHLSRDYTYEKNYTTAVTAKDQEKIDSEKAAALSNAKKTTPVQVSKSNVPTKQQTNTLIPKQFLGLWGDTEKTCRKVLAAKETHEMAIADIAPKAITYGLSSCTVKSVMGDTNGNLIDLNMVCEGEGDEWKVRTNLKLLSQARLAMHDEGEKQALQFIRCRK